VVAAQTRRMSVAPLYPAHGGADKKIWACCHGPTRYNTTHRRLSPTRNRRRPMPTRALIRVLCPRRLPLRNRRSRRTGFGTSRRGVAPRTERRRSRGPRVQRASRDPLRCRYARSLDARSVTMAIATTGVATAVAIPMRPETGKRAVHARAARRPGRPLPRAPRPRLAAVDSEQELTRAQRRYHHG